MWRSLAIGVFLAGVLAACSSSGTSNGDPTGVQGVNGRVWVPEKTLHALTPQQAQSSRLTIRTLHVSRQGVGVGLRDTLSCDPPSGSVPDPSMACHALQDFLAHFRPKGGVRFCGSRIRPHRVVEIWATVGSQKFGMAAIDQPGRCRLPRRLKDDLAAITGTSGIGAGDTS